MLIPCQVFEHCAQASTLCQLRQLLLLLLHPGRLLLLRLLLQQLLLELLKLRLALQVRLLSVQARRNSQLVQHLQPQALVTTRMRCRLHAVAALERRRTAGGDGSNWRHGVGWVGGRSLEQAGRCQRAEQLRCGACQGVWCMQCRHGCIRLLLRHVVQEVLGRGVRGQQVHGSCCA